MAKRLAVIAAVVGSSVALLVTAQPGATQQTYTPPGSAPDGYTALCADGFWSASQNRSGTCSNHGGVAQFYAPLTSQSPGGPCPTDGCKTLYAPAGSGYADGPGSSTVTSLTPNQTYQPTATPAPGFTTSPTFYTGYTPTSPTTIVPQWSGYPATSTFPQTYGSPYVAPFQTTATTVPQSQTGTPGATGTMCQTQVQRGWDGQIVQQQQQCQ